MDYIDPELSVNGLQWFANGDRLTKLRLTEMMSKRYPLGAFNDLGNYEMSLCDSMVRQLWLYLE